MFDIVKAFKCKLVLWEKQRKNDDLTHFPTCNTNRSNLNDTASYQKYAEKNSNHRTEFETRFKDCNSLEDKLCLFSAVFSINIDSVSSHMEMEVIEIQRDLNLKAKFIEMGVSELYKHLPDRFENTRKFAYEIIAMFWKYVSMRAQLFSVMKKKKKSSVRNNYAHLVSFESNYGEQNFSRNRKDSGREEMSSVRT
ncbi:hypothetical protein QE152_g28354 [Popillia japonica]|uniref:Uncharacterized protein n=1 Tax=Popillia japonica TaxID=7064 RepID=A0AAW1JK07_POPJA